MYQTTTQTSERARSFVVGHLTALIAYWPLVLFTAYMVIKQRMVLANMGLWPGPANLFATLGAVAALAVWAFVPKGRTRWLTVALVDLILSFLVYADLVYYRQFGDLVSIASLRFAGQLSTVADSVTVLMSKEDLWFFLEIPILAALAFVPTKWLEKVKMTPVFRPRAAATTALAGALVVVLVTFFDPMLKAKYFGHSNVASRLGLLGYHTYDISSYTGRMAKRLLPSANAVEETKLFFAKKRTAGGTPPSQTAGSLIGAAKGKNVIALQVESLQAFTIGLRVDGQEVTPNLNRYLKESIYFEDFYTQTGQGVTSDADLLANCSLYPTRTGAVYYDYAHNDFYCMPKLLREHGYKAVAMQGMPPDFWNLGTVYPKVGFERYYNIADYQLDEKIGIGLSDESFLRQTVAKLKELPKPYYAFVVTLTSHGPFDFEGLPKSLKLGALEGTMAGDYLHAVHYTDAAIGKFLDTLKADGTLDDAVLLLYGDHAGVFRNSPGMEELLNIDPDDELGLTYMEKRVPFLIRMPGGQGAEVRSQIAGEVDIAPTLAGLLGVPTQSAHFMGRDLNRQSEGFSAFYTGSAMDEKHLYWSSEGDPLQGKCYSRASGKQVPPEECVPLANQAGKELSISRTIVERNLIPKLMERP